MVRAAALILLSLTACDPLVRQSDLDNMRAEMDRVNQAELSALKESRNALQERVELLEGQAKVNDLRAKEALATTDAVAEQVSNNARVANENAVKDMTARGACGREQILDEEVGFVWRNKECTINDLKK